MANWNDILSGKDEEVNDDELLKYVNGDLPDEDIHRIEQKIASSAFVNDAVDGLQEFNNKERLNSYVRQLNKDLHIHLNARKSKQQKRQIKDYPYTWITIIVVLSICILGYFVIHLYKNNKVPVPANRQQENTQRTITPSSLNPVAKG
ncbi:hypothetical protein EXU57_05550 [Segetibacter sp. 3557_3]|uniref:hypothetical protein n=1 Tax=Segetibacter sp. 3557_3 TaxID=2547429 RepID=UPI001058701B|nr:hypothetical protein [Segetibacter sp. 3557_3]TDH27931.1 hypothetical protein EXU57_05550 [Segetibacter sp. 3557_3]